MELLYTRYIQGKNVILSVKKYPNERLVVYVDYLPYLACLFCLSEKFCLIYQNE